jgi:integrase
MATYRKRTNPSGSVTHQFIVRRQGYRTRVFSHEKKSVARRLARAHETALDRGEAERGEETVNDAFDFYLASSAYRGLRSEKARRERKKQLEWWRRRIGDLPLADLRAVQKAIQRARLDLLKGESISGEAVSEPTVNRYMASAGKALRVAERDADMGSLLIYNPARRVERFDERDRNRTRIFTDEEFWKLYRECRKRSRRLAVMFLVAVSSAARKSKIELIKRSTIDLEAGEILLERTKNGEDRIAVVSGFALDALRDYLARLPSTLEEFVFAGPKGAPYAPRKKWYEARKAAGVLDTGWHTCRHTSLTFYASLGASERELREHGGHKTDSALQGYIHNARRVESKVAALLLPEPIAVRRARDREALRAS